MYSMSPYMAHAIPYTEIDIQSQTNVLKNHLRKTHAALKQAYLFLYWEV